MLKSGEAIGEPVLDEMDEVFESVARYFSILAEPARLRILMRSARRKSRSARSSTRPA